MKIYAVGGSVRDELLGYPIKDEDFVVVGSTPEQMLQLGYKKVGADFPVFLDDRGREFALARTERKTGPGYNGFETKFDSSITLEADLLRRDLTINAIAKDIETGEIIDPCGGIGDLKRGMLKHVSEAFAEDPLRVLRVARFRARYKFNVWAPTMSLMIELSESGELDNLTAERVWTELEKALMEENPVLFFDTLCACKAFPKLFSDIVTNYTIDSALTAAALRNSPLIERIMVLFAHTPVGAGQLILTRLRAPVKVMSLVAKFQTIIEAVGLSVNINFNALELLLLLKTLYAYQRPDDLYILSSALGYFDRSRDMDKVLKAYTESKRVCFASLTEEQQATLKGSDIGKAIDDLRVKRIEPIDIYLYE